MKYLIICCLVFFSCTDDRSLDYEDFEARPSFVANVFQTQYTAELINSGNDSIPTPNSIRDFIDINIFNESFNVNNLIRLEFKFLAENSINREQSLGFVFFDANGNETFELTEPIPEGRADNPTLKSFSVELNAQEIDRITSSIRAEISIDQPSTATNTGEMRLECIVEGGYLYPGE